MHLNWWGKYSEGRISPWNDPLPDVLPGSCWIYVSHRRNSEKLFMGFTFCWFHLYSLQIFPHIHFSHLVHISYCSSWVLIKLGHDYCMWSNGGLRFFLSTVLFVFHLLRFVMLCFLTVSALQGSGYRHRSGPGGRSVAGLCHPPRPGVQGRVCSLPPPPGDFFLVNTVDWGKDLQYNHMWGQSAGSFDETRGQQQL